jgi:hypothetical protein
MSSKDSLYTYRRFALASVPRGSYLSSRGSGGEDDGLLILVLHLGVKDAKAGILLGSKDDISENVVATDSEACSGGLGGHDVGGVFFEGGFIARGE